MEGLLPSNQLTKSKLSPKKAVGSASHLSNKHNQVGTVMLYGIPIVSLIIESQERLCLAQISNTLLKQYSYNEIHNRRVALGITCVQCTPVQLEILRRAGAMPVSSRRCGMITRREAERLCKSFLGDNAPPRLPDDFAFSVHHECAWGCRGAFLPSRYNSSRAKCIKCTFCGLFFSPNKFIFHSHRTTPNATYIQPDAANFNSWRRHMKLSGSPPDDVVHAWEDVKAMFNGGTRKRLLASSSAASSLPIRSTIAATVPITIASTVTKQIKLDTSMPTNSSYSTSAGTPIPVPTSPRVPPFPDLTLPISMMDYVWHNGINSDGIKQFPFAPYAVPWFENAKRSVLGLSSLPSGGPKQETLLQHLCSPNNSDKLYHHSAFRPVFPPFTRSEVLISPDVQSNVIKRHINAEEIILPKKRYSREAERIENSSVNFFSDSDNGLCRIGSIQGRCESVDKENDLRKSSENDENRGLFAEVVTGNMSQNAGAKITFKKELISEAASDSNDGSKVILKSRSKSDGKELIDVSRLLSLKPALLEDSVFRFREFSPNLLEAISNLKTEDREAYTELTAKIYQDRGLHSDSRKRKASDAEDDDEQIRNFSRSEEDEEDQERGGGGDGENDDNVDGDDDDEPVDVETTDDLPAGRTSICAIQEVYNVEKATTKRLDEETKSRNSPESEKLNRIWTVAKFSLEEPEKNSTILQPGGISCTTEHNNIIYKARKESEAFKRSICEKKQKMEDINFCQIAFGNG